MPWNKNENVSIKWFNFVQAREKEKEQKKLLKFFFLIATGEISDQKSLFYRGKWKISTCGWHERGCSLSFFADR